jgi:hypothetical protein
MFRTGLRRITEALADRIPKMKRAAAGKDGLEAEFETDAAKLPDMGVKPVETAKPGEVEADRT